jgi:hypothetical protein
MRLRQLFENIYETVPEGGEEHDGSLKTIGICFGRWNPPHKGHKNVWQHASANPIWYVGTNENTGGTDIKNPLPYDVKLQVMAAVWPEVAGHVIPEQDLFVMCSHIYEEHGENVHLNIYTDEQWLYTGLAKNNGVQGKHGFYKFNQIDNKPMKRLASATDLRANALSGNKKAFYKDMGISPSTTIDIEGQSYPVFEVVAHYLNLQQKISEGLASVLAKAIMPAEKTLATKPLVSKTPGPLKTGEMPPDIKMLINKVQNKVPLRPDEYSKLQAYKAFRDADSMSLKEANMLARALREGSAGAVGKGGTKPMDKEKKAAMKNTTTLPGINMATGSMYKNYRMGIALAGAPTFPTKIEADNWIGGDPLISSYTEEEYEMVKAAALQVGAGAIENWSGKRSEEIPGINKTSPIAKIKKNKYGI